MIRNFSVQRLIAPALLLASFGCGGCGDSATAGPDDPPNPPPGAGTIHVNATQQFQVMTGWQAVAEAGEIECQGYGTYQEELFRRAANELGINRLRLELRAGAENSRDFFGELARGEIPRSTFIGNWYRAVNDNSDPNTIDPDGFHFSELDARIDRVVLPLRRELQARGEQLFVLLTYLDHGPSAWEHSNAPEEYAELILAAFQHMQGKYGFVPDAVEVVNEPDKSDATFTAAQIGPAVAAAGQRLRVAGFNPPFVAPSTISMSRTLQYFEPMSQMPAAMQFVAELSYHRYGASSVEDLEAIAARARQHGIRTAMLEHINSGPDELYDDLTIAQVSSWNQFALAFCSEDGSGSGGTYIWIDENDPSKLYLTDKARHLAQYFRNVRMGARRIGANSSNSELKPVAFVNTNGGQALIVNASSEESFTVSGLAAGTYGITYSTGSGDGTHPDVTLTTGQQLSTSIPAEGVIAIFRR